MKDGVLRGGGRGREKLGRKQKGKVCAGDTWSTALAFDITIFSFLKMRFFLCLCRILDLHHFRDILLILRLTKGNVFMQSVLVFRQKFVDAGWGLNLVDGSLVIVLKRCQRCQGMDTCMQYKNLEMNVLNEKLIETCIRTFKDCGSLDFPYQF